jgi:hypothetical protein
MVAAALLLIFIISSAYDFSRRAVKRVTLLLA